MGSKTKMTSTKGIILVCLSVTMLFANFAYCGLIGHWRLDEKSGTTAPDSSGLGYDGTLVGAPVWEPSEGTNGAIHLAATDRVALPRINVGASFTVMGWVKPDAHVIWGGLMASRYWDGFYLGTTDYQNWAFIVNNNFGLASGLDTFLIGEWQHVAGVYATGIATLYVDGAPVATRAMSAPSVPNQPVVIGRPDGASVPGLVDDIRIYNTALSSAEIEAIVVSPPLPGAVSLSQPKTRAVFQRDDQNIARVPINGLYSDPVTAIEARALVMGGFGGTDTGWQVIDASPTGGFFSATLPVAAGGWYSIEVRPFDGATPGPTSKVDRIGIGEVFITCGQSNSANFGTPPMTPTYDIVSAWTGSRWRHGYDPQPITDGGGGSPWSRLGDMLAEHFGCPIGFVSVGVGGTRVDEWVPGAAYYNRIQSAITAMGDNGMRAILWHQGESDSYYSTSAAVYESRLNSIITQSRTDAGWDVPWGVAIASYGPASTPAQEAEIRAGQQQVIAGDPLVFKGAVTDGFYDLGYLSDGIHFNAAGLYQHALGWERAISKNLFPCDFERDEDVDIEDLAVFSIYWLYTNCIETSDCERCDFFDDDVINLNDFSICAQNWLN